MEKLRIGLLFGGRSVEHDVSIVSARSILAALDQSRYDVSLLAVDQQGRWHFANADTALLAVQEEACVFLPPDPGSATLVAADDADQGDTLITGDVARDAAIDAALEVEGEESAAEEAAPQTLSETPRQVQAQTQPQTLPQTAPHTDGEDEDELVVDADR